ncbi:hypothetical protein [Haladaptatus sp. CMAA 1911]|uniref:hypothetical protein n=1 Tax=unclassified Haladaptatus TaxID=2622732 RepID=UPI0037540F14
MTFRLPNRGNGDRYRRGIVREMSLGAVLAGIAGERRGCSRLPELELFLQFGDGSNHTCSAVRLGGTVVVDFSIVAEGSE